MALTQDQIIEIQTAAEFNFKKRLKEVEDAKALEKEIAKKQSEAKESKSVNKEK